ncbi:MAG: PIG-L family deacetylase [Spirochaetales bacterium]|nr:PIG-L family deacetylase [Spirochaetales bacterium]
MEKKIYTSSDYLSFRLLCQKKKIALLNIDAEETILYDISLKGKFNTFLEGFSDKKLNVKLVRNACNWQIVCSREVLINGVAWRKRDLKEGDTIHLGEYRLVFEGKFSEEIPVLKPQISAGKKKRLIRVVEAAAIVEGVSFLWFCTTYKTTSFPDNYITANSLSDHETELPYEYSDELDELDISQVGVSAESPGLIVYGPKDKPLSHKLDILFIHTHPDDESLDYGLYIAREAAKGKSVGVILFTDGDSGFDKYPDRRTDSFYTDSYLKGSDLARVREKEAERALALLGADIFVHLGLWNRPYTALEASKSVHTISKEWGGEEFLVDTLLILINRFKPEIIVSPDGPSGAREHFEHETVGYISEKAVDIYIENNPGELKAYLKLVDVEQTDYYNDIPLIKINSEGDKSFLEKKRTALMMHQTQADASFFGIKRLKKFPVEYYVMPYFSSDLAGTDQEGLPPLF